MKEKADVVIADLPCSGLGVMGRKPDIRYNITEDKLVSLKSFSRAYFLLYRHMLSRAV